MRELSKEGSVDQWSNVHDKVIQEIKDILTKRENLGFFHEGDLGDLGLGAILLQVNGTTDRLTLMVARVCPTLNQDLVRQRRRL